MIGKSTELYRDPEQFYTFLGLQNAKYLVNFKKKLRQYKMGKIRKRQFNK